MIRDCSYYVRRAEMLESLAALGKELDLSEGESNVLAGLCDDIMELDAVCDEQLADAMKFRRAWTDPRTGITYFPRKER